MSFAFYVSMVELTSAGWGKTLPGGIFALRICDLFIAANNCFKSERMRRAHRTGFGRPMLFARFKKP